MQKIPQAASELLEHLEEQLQFLIASADSYDRGFEGEAKRMATALRVLLHDTDKSSSLLGQLGLKSRNFFDSAAHADAMFATGKRFGSYTPLSGVSAGKDGRYVPYLDETLPEFVDFVPFDDFWKREIFVDNGNNSFTREDIVLAVANKDGGSHVDPNLNKDYHQLSRQNSMGWEITTGGTTVLPAGKVELAALRQITHEVLRTLKSDYPKKSMNHKGLPIFAPAMMMTMGNFKPPAVKIVGPKDMCPCASGLESERCHGIKS